LLLGRETRAARTSTTRASWAVMLLAFVAVVIRAEIFGLLGLLTFQLLSGGSLSFTRLVKVGAISGLVCIGMRLPSANIHETFIPIGPTSADRFD